jgi:hypothetical protein
MRLPAYGLLVLSVLILAAATTSQPRAAAGCQPVAPEAATPAKPSSFAPHPHSRKRVYGAPIQKPLVKSHTRHRPHPAKKPPPPRAAS